MAATPALDLDLVRTLVPIAEEKSFTRAADRVGRTQSTVSLQVQRLEAADGVMGFGRKDDRSHGQSPPARYAASMRVVGFQGKRVDLIGVICGISMCNMNPLVA
jgi:hypothetical protein